MKLWWMGIFQTCSESSWMVMFCGVEFLPSEKKGMARVVCDELARQAYDSSTDVFVKRLIQLRELSEDWAQIDRVKESSAAAISPDKKTQTHDVMYSGNDLSDNDDNDVCDVSMVCDEIPSTSEFTGQERQARPISREFTPHYYCTEQFTMFTFWF